MKPRLARRTHQGDAQVSRVRSAGDRCPISGAVAVAVFAGLDERRAKVLACYRRLTEPRREA